MLASLKRLVVFQSRCVTFERFKRFSEARAIVEETTNVLGNLQHRRGLAIALVRVEIGNNRRSIDQEGVASVVRKLIRCQAQYFTIISSSSLSVYHDTIISFYGSRLKRDPRRGFST